MGKQSRPNSGKQQAPAAPVPLKADPPAPKGNAPAVSTPAQAPVDTDAIESQVDALLDQAQQQVQTMSELVNEPESAPPPSRDEKSEGVAPKADAPTESPTPAPAAEIDADSPEAIAAVEATAAALGDEVDLQDPPEPVDAESLDPIDTDALQGQVDAILAEVGYPATPPTQASSPATGPAQSPPVAESDATPPPPIAPSRESPAKPAPVEVQRAAASAFDEQADEGADADAEMDIASVDAVIADAARRAMEEDDFDSSDADPGAADPGSASGAQAAPRREPVIKRGDASMRREKPKKAKPRRSHSDLDGPAGAPSVEPTEAPRPLGESSDEQVRPLELQAPAGLKARVRHYTLQGMAAMNAPWKTWSTSTRYSVLAITFLNFILAGAAYFILLRRWF